MSTSDHGQPHGDHHQRIEIRPNRPLHLELDGRHCLVLLCPVDGDDLDRHRLRIVPHIEPDGSHGPVTETDLYQLIDDLLAFH